MPLSRLARGYDQFILDLDGCVWIGDEPTPRAVEAIEALREDGRQVAYATNDPRSATEDYVARLWKIGVRASVRDVVTVGGAVVAILYADGPAPDPPGEGRWPSVIEVLARHASRVLNAMTVERAVGLWSPGPTPRAASSVAGRQRSGGVL